MKKQKILLKTIVLFSVVLIYSNCFGQNRAFIEPTHEVSLKEAHKGTLEIDTKLLDSYDFLPENVRSFYFDSREILIEKKQANFNDEGIVKSAQKNNMPLMGGPLLGNLSESGVVLWLRPSSKNTLKIKVSALDGSIEKVYKKRSIKPGVEQRIELDGLKANSSYEYAVYSKKSKIAEGKFTTAPVDDSKDEFRLAFGSCFHKIGLHNPNLINQILARKPQAMMLLGDIAVDDRENNINKHRSDYMLRDLSAPWKNLAANVPLYATWDDHDYLNNDLSGVPKRFTNADKKALLEVWQQNWNNPENEKEGIYFNTHIGSVEVIMLDTRSCRTVKERRQYGSYLGMEQMKWLKETLRNSTAPFKVVSSGTMWSDYVTKGKDSWGTWDTLAREEIFSFIETENIPGVLLISGDRHGARGFRIPRKSGFAFHEFEAASLGGVPGPPAKGDDDSTQLFGYIGADLRAFGEFTFNTKGESPIVTFRLIDESGKELEKHVLPYSKLTP